MESFAERIQILSIQFVPFMIAVVGHEFGHGFVASLWGDKTAKDSGRLTLNPIPHIDVLGTLVFPIIGMLSGMSLLFGWAKPVPINPSRFRKYRQGLFSVAFAGPGANFILAIFSAFLMCAFLKFMPKDFYLFEPLFLMARVSVSLNFALGIFNLLPIPPLDGSKIIESFLSYQAMQKYEQLTQYSFYILMALIFTGALQILSYPIQFLTQITIGGAAYMFGIQGGA